MEELALAVASIEYRRLPGAHLAVQETPDLAADILSTLVDELQESAHGPR